MTTLMDSGLSLSIESWAACGFDLFDALGIASAAVVGLHTGAAIAIEMAASYPERVRALVLSASPYVDAAKRAAFTAKYGSNHNGANAFRIFSGSDESENRNAAKNGVGHRGHFVNPDSDPAHLSDPSPAAPLGGIRQSEHVQTGEQEQEERQQR